MTVFCGPSIWREINVRTASAVMVAIQSSPGTEKVIWAPIWNDALIGRSRSLMCTEFLKTDADVMVIIDDDIVFDPRDFWKIVEGCRATRSIYGGAYVTRGLEPHLTSRWLPDTPEIRFGATPQRRPIEFQYLATGFFALHRGVLERMIDADIADADGSHKVAECTLGADKPFYPFFMPFQCIEDDGSRHYLSEDWAFCNRARQLGFRVWVDQSIILQHMGLYPYTVFDQQNPGNGFPSKGIDTAVFTPDAKPSIHPLVDSLTADIAEWAEEDLGDARRLIENGQKRTQELWRRKPVGQTEAEWYRREDVGLAYICDLAGWHQRGALPMKYADTLNPRDRVYDFGAGIGTWALAAARAGAHVTTYEPNPVMREFTAWRAQKYETPVGIASEPFGGEYDVINCWHVFEHLEDPEGALDELLSMLAPAGVLITDSGFKDQNTPQHHAHHDWEAVLASRGLKALGPGLYQLQPVSELVAV